MILISEFIESMKFAFDEYSRLGIQVYEGTMTFKKFDELIMKKENWQQFFTALMKFANMDDDKRNDRLQQIKVYQQINNIKKIISALLIIREKFELMGDFSVLEDMNESVSKRLRI